jgi:GGDEF domain-containing protein
MRKKGFFITLEGTDGVGKTTHSTRLAQWMQSGGFSVERTREPGGGKVAEKIRSDLADQGFEFERGTLSVTGSFGVSTFPEDATSGQQLFRQADQRLYKAKHAGRNQTKGRIG